MGNITLLISVLISSLLYMPAFRLKPPGGNDEGATGYMMIIVIFFHLVLWVFLAISAMLIARKGGFDWISGHALLRNVVVVAGLTAIIIFSVGCALSGLAEQGIPEWAGLLMRFSYPVIPVILIGTGFILYNDWLREMAPLSLYKWPLTALFVLGMTGAAVFLSIFIGERNRSAARHRGALHAIREAGHQNELKFIDSCNVQTDFVYLLSYTHAGREADVHAKALAKIKSRPDWQEQLAWWLEHHGVIEVLVFLSNNTVDNRQLLAEPLRKGIVSLTEHVRTRISYITHPSYANPRDFMSETSLILGAVPQFEGLGVDYVPAVRAFRAVFDEPSPVGRLKFDCTADLDAWLRKR